jgi:glycogen debranching enzyme
MREAEGAMRREVEWLWPRDLRRDVMVPPGFALKVIADFPFRASLAGADGATSLRLESFPDQSSAGRHCAAFQPPAVVLASQGCGGHGLTHVRLRVTVFENGRAVHGEGRIVPLPPFGEAAFASRIDCRAVREGGCCAVLASPRGASSLVRASFGIIRGQYDALLAMNLDPSVPANRTVFLTRCLAWVRRKGYSAAVDAACATSFQAMADGLGAEWRFDVPVGEGMAIGLVARLRLSPRANAVRLGFFRVRPSGACAPGRDDRVTLVLRPDMEWRDFHAKTIADFSTERHFCEATRPFGDGFAFSPDPRFPTSVRIKGAQFHGDAVWSRAVAHPEDASRGLGPSGDLYSPGWFGVDLAEGEGRWLEAGLDGELAAAFQDAPFDASTSPARATVGEWMASDPLSMYIADRDGLKTVIAGFPWFLDWGRDTLIVLRGLIASGRTEVATEIIREFGRFEDHGTLPNIIHGTTVGNRDTSDAPLWFAVAVGDLAERISPARVSSLKCGGRTVVDVVRSIARNYICGTPNGIRVDPATGLVFSPAHFTWMDTNYPAGTPREGYPVEIQALWIAALAVLRRHFGVNEFEAVRERASMSLARLFPVGEGWLSDCLRASPGQGASDALKDDALRPNQLLAVTLGAIPSGGEMARAVVRATSELLVPGAIRSLADRTVTVPQPVAGANGLLNDPLNPFWGRYEGDEDTRRKPAYHNGTAWTWQFPLFCEALWRVFGDDARDTALALLGSISGMLETGALRQLPEIADGASPHAQRGCPAQAWGVSEAIRVFHVLEPPMP